MLRLCGYCAPESRRVSFHPLRGYDRGFHVPVKFPVSVELVVGLRWRLTQPTNLKEWQIFVFILFV